MSAQNAKDAADDFVAQLRLTKEAKGRKFQLVTFASDEDCRFFYPRRALNFHRQMNTYVSRALRERYGVRVQRVAISPADFHNRPEIEVHVGEVPMSPEQAKRKFADSHLHLL